MIYLDQVTIRWILGIATVAALIILTALTQREFRRIEKLQDSPETKKLEAGADNPEMDEPFAATLEKDPDA